MEVVASLSQGRTAAAQCGLFTRKSVPVIFETPCINQSKVDNIMCWNFSESQYQIKKDKFSNPRKYGQETGH